MTTGLALKHSRDGFSYRPGGQDPELTVAAGPRPSERARRESLSPAVSGGACHSWACGYIALLSRPPLFVEVFSRHKAH